jgi:hypothetical protein
MKGMVSMNKDDRFGKLVFTGETIKIKDRWHGVFKCDCGNEKIILLSNVERGKSSTCGCSTRNNFGITSSDYKSITSARRRIIWRCYKPGYPNYEVYGGKGITVCDEWRNSIGSFVEWALANGWRKELTIDRIDNSKGYSPDNCRWATYKEQARNRNTNVLYEHNGVTKCVMEWCEELGIPYYLAYGRRTRGITDFESVFAPSLRR